MKKEGWTMAVPSLGDSERKQMQELPFLNLNATYVQRGKSAFPKASDRPQWQRRSHYWKDLYRAVYGDIQTDLEWVK